MSLTARFKTTLPFSKLILLGNILLNLTLSPTYAMLHGKGGEASSSTHKSASVVYAKNEDLRLSDELQRVLRTDTPSKSPEEAYTRPKRELVPFAQYVEKGIVDYLSETSTYVQYVEPLLDEVRDMIGSEKVSMAGLWTLCLRFASFISPQSVEERILLENDIHPFLKAGEGGGSEKEFMNTIFPIQGFFREDTLHCWPHTWENKARYLLSTMLPLPVYYPLLGHESLPLAHRVRNAIEDIFPVCSPVRPSRALGIDLSPWGAVNRNLSQLLSDDRYHSLHDHILERAQASINPPAFAERYAPVAAQKYRMLIGVFKEILDNLEPLKSQDPERYMKVLFCLHIVLYEEDNFSSRIWNKESLKSIFDDLICFEDEEEPVEEGADYLATDPVTGKSPRTNEEIIEWSRKQCVSEISDDDHDAKVIRTPFSITVYHTSLYGSARDLGISYPTMLKLHKRLVDELTLFAEVGYQISSPDFSKEGILQTMRQVQEAKKDSIACSHEYVMRTIRRASSGKERSLCKKFKEQTRALEQEFQESLKADPLPPFQPEGASVGIASFDSCLGSLGRETFENTEGMGRPCLAIRLKALEVTESLDLEGEALTDEDMRVLAAFLPTSAVKHLGLSQNSISDRGAEVLANALSGFSGLVSIELSNNQIGTPGACALAGAFLQLPNVVSIYLENNLITLKGAEALRKVTLCGKGGAANLPCRIGLFGNPISPEQQKTLTQPPSLLYFEES